MEEKTDLRNFPEPKELKKKIKRFPGFNGDYHDSLINVNKYETPIIKENKSFYEVLPLGIRYRIENDTGNLAIRHFSEIPFEDISQAVRGFGNTMDYFIYETSSEYLSLDGERTAYFIPNKEKLRLKKEKMSTSLVDIIKEINPNSKII